MLLRDLRSLFIMILFACLLAPLSAAVNEEIAGQLNPAQKRQLQALGALSVAGLSEVNDATASARIAELTRILLELDVPAVGSRSYDADGRAPIHHYLRDRVTALEPHGMQLLGSLRGRVAAPVSLDRMAEDEQREASARLAFADQTWRVHPFWPNGPMPSLVPQGGLSGPLIYVGRADWQDLQGLTLDNSIAVLDFAGARRMELLFSLGAHAVIVVEDDFVLYENARLLFSSTPMPFPRFYLGREDGAQQLIEVAAAQANAVREGMSAATAQLNGGNMYRMRPVESLFAFLPASAPVTLAIEESTLLSLIAADYGLSSEDLLHVNQWDSPVLRAGQPIRLPGGRGSISVRSDELMTRIALLYGVATRELREANGLAAGEEPPPGTVLQIPNATAPMLITVDMDTASVVPDLPHGARAIANLAATLLLMEHVATSRHLNRRRDLVFAFMDGNTLGGFASRLLAEYLYMQDNVLATAGGSRGISDLQILDYYDAAAAWFSDGRVPDSPAVAHWLARDWLMGHLEDARIALAEQRIPLVLKLNNSSDPDLRAAAEAELRQLEAELRRVVDVRIASLAQRRLSTGGQLDALFAILSDPQQAAELRRYGLTLDALGGQFERERAEERLLRRNHVNNHAIAAELLTRLRVSGVSGLRLGIQLDLLDGSPHLGIGFGEDPTLRLRGEIRAANYARNAAPRLRKVAAYAASTAGWQEPHTFIGVEDSATLAMIPTRQTPSYSDFWRFADVALIPLAGRNDRTPLIDTPADDWHSLNLVNFSLQARTAFTLVGLMLESPSDSTVNQSFPRPEISLVSGRTVQFNIRSGIDARDPVADTTVYLPFYSGDGGFSSENVHGYFGYRRGAVSLSRLNGAYRMPLEIQNYHPRPQIFAYQLNRADALFRKSMNQGQVGTKPQDTVFSYRRGSEVERNLVMIDTYPLAFFPGVDPSNYIAMGGSPRGPVRIDLVDAVREGEPRDYTVDNPMRNFRESGMDGLVLHLPVGTRVRAMVRQGMDYRMLLVGPMDATNVRSRGAGYLIGPGEQGDRNVFLPLAPQLIATEMTQLARNRLDIYRSYGIASRPLEAAVTRSEEKLQLADAALAARNWREAIGYSREAWGIMVKNYPRILGLGREAVFSVILLMAFLVPAAWFLQSLFSGAKGIVAQLGWASAIFAVGTLFLNTFHPAFRIALSPFIVVIAFTMILISSIVIGLSYQRFDVLLRRFRSASGEVESEEISFISSLATAFSLGISNLRKRMFRTVLTVLTVTALTFSIIAFVAISGRDTVQRVSLNLDSFLDGGNVEPLSPAYNGMLLRNFQWQQYDSARMVALETEFGGRLDLTVRAHYLEVEGGNNAVREGVNQIPVRGDNGEHILTGIMVFQPNEIRFSGLHRAVSGGQWFLDNRHGPDGPLAADRFRVILPDVAAHALGITAADLLDADGQRLADEALPLVRMSGSDWRVIGILDTDHANRIRDVNGRSLAMVDYLRSGMSPAVAGKLEQEGDSYHMNWERLAIVPYAALHDVGARLRSVALRFPDDLDHAGIFHDIALRLKEPFFAHNDGEISFVVPRQRIDMGGLAKIILPVVLCILIVMNTMLGTVEERKGEVGMLGAIGLSPRQIAFLMFSESTVFSILGIVFGIFGGLLFSNIVQGLNAHDIAFLSGLSFNFTSLISMLLATATGLVVLMATLVPARKAAAMAAPSGMAAWELPPPDDSGAIHFVLPFTLTRGNAVGMAAFFRQFLLNHTETTSEDFNCREVVLRQCSVLSHPALELETEMWLMPYDLDVAQTFVLRLHPGETAGVFVVDLRLLRCSGSEENWIRTAYNFLNRVRQQFLYWRNLAPEARTRYIEEGARLLNSHAIPMEAVRR